MHENYLAEVQPAQIGQEDLFEYLFLIYALSYPLEISDSHLQRGLQLLSTNELSVYKGISTRPKRREYLLSRVLVRRIISTLLNCSLQSLYFHTTLHGKPWLPSFQIDQPTLSFNFSHSERFLLLGISHYGEIGIDVEMIGYYRPRIAQRCFSTEEYSWLEGLAPELQAAAFTQLWTVKEACSKAIGLGLQLPLLKIPIFSQNSEYYENLWWQTLPIYPTATSAVALQISPGRPTPTRGKIIEVSCEWLLTEK